MTYNRLAALRELLKKQHCTHILVSDTVDVEYISGFHSSSAVLLVSRNAGLLFTDFRYKEAAEKFCGKNSEWKFVLAAESNFKYIGDYVKKGSVLGIQSNSLTIDRYDELKSVCRGSRLLRLSTRISDLSIRKLPGEIASMRKAASAGDKAFEAILGYLKSGVTEIDIAQTLERLCSDFGSQKPSFDTIVLFGPRTALPHGRPGQTRLKRGDWVLFDFGCTIDGFFSDMTRTVVAGRADERQKHIYSIVLRAQETARKTARSGIKTSELDSYARKIIESEGYGEQFGHALGHGVGLRIHERPRVSPHINEILMENTVVTIEPGVYITGFGGVRIEDMVVLHDNGAGVLTRAPRDLIETNV